MSILQLKKKIITHAEKKNITHNQEKKQSSGSKNDHILKLADENFTTVIINMLKDFRKTEQKKWQVENISREMQTWKENQKEILELKNSVKVTQSCPILCNPTDCRLPGSSVHGIHQIRIPEWVAIPFSTGSSQPRNQTLGLIFHTAGRFFTVWATKEIWETAPEIKMSLDRRNNRMGTKKKSCGLDDRWKENIQM